MNSTRARVTVTLPTGLLDEIDRRERNRSRFVVEAVERELERRRRDDFRRSLQNPHPESAELAEAGFDEWARGLPDEPAADLVDLTCGRAIRWVPDVGWRDADQRP